MADYVLIRETLDWRRAGRAALRDDAIRGLAEVWDATLGVPFTECRALIKEAALAFLAAIPGALVLMPEDRHDLRLAEGDLLLISDDDDWYDPAVFTALRAAGAAGRAGAVWPDGVYGFHSVWRPAAAGSEGPAIEEWLDAPKPRPLDDGRAFSPIKTNNYALTSHWPGRLDGVLAHDAAARALAPALADGRLLRLDRVLSLANRHPCSYLTLTTATAGRPPGPVMRRLVETYAAKAAGVRLPLAMAWATPHIRRMAEIFSAVSGR